MKVKQKIPLMTNNIQLFSMASASNESTILCKIAIDNNAPESEIKNIKRICEIFSSRFWQAVDHFYPDYSEHKMRLKGALEELTLYIYDLQPCNDCAGCDNCDSKILNLTESLKSAGIDTADEFVEKLADQLAKKTGGRA